MTNNPKHSVVQHRLSFAILLALGASTLVCSPEASAYRWDYGNGVELNFDTTLSYGVQVRTQDRYSGLIGRDNGGTVPTTGDLGELLHGPGGGVAANPDFNFLNGDNGNLNYDPCLSGCHTHPLPVVFWASVPVWGDRGYRRT